MGGSEGTPPESSLNFNIIQNFQLKSYPFSDYFLFEHRVCVITGQFAL